MRKEPYLSSWELLAWLSFALHVPSDSSQAFGLHATSCVGQQDACQCGLAAPGCPPGTCFPGSVFGEWNEGTAQTLLGQSVRVQSVHIGSLQFCRP